MGDFLFAFALWFLFQELWYWCGELGQLQCLNVTCELTWVTRNQWHQRCTHKHPSSSWALKRPWQLWASPPGGPSLASAACQTQFLILTNMGPARKIWTQALQAGSCEGEDWKGKKEIKVLSCFWSCYIPLQINQKVPPFHFQQVILKNTSKGLVLEERNSFSVPLHCPSTCFRHYLSVAAVDLPAWTKRDSTGTM